MFNYLHTDFGMVTRTSPYSGLDPFTADDGVTFDLLERRSVGLHLCIAHLTKDSV